jgi:phage protein D
MLDGKRLEAEVLGLLTRLEVRESDVDSTVAALRFNLSQLSDGEFSPVDEELFTPAARLSLDVEAPGNNPVRLFDGHVTHVRPHFERIESNCYVEILAMDATLLLGAEERVASYPDMTDAEAAEQIFGRYNIPFSSEPTAARHEADKQLLVQRGTDWDFVRRLARRNGFVCYLEPDAASGRVTAFFKPRAVTGTPQADLTVLREDSNLLWIDFQFVTTGPVRARGVAIDPIEKRLVRSEGAPSLEPLGKALLDGEVESGLKDAGAKAVVTLLRDPPPLGEAITAAGSAATDRALLAVEARGEVEPSLYRGLLRARRPVLVKGVGRRFAGTYYVRAVRTTFEEGLLRQSFVAERNAIGLGGGEEFGKSAEEVPPQ